MRRAMVLTLLVLAGAAGPALAADAESLAMGRVRFTTDPAAVQGCAHVGQARDDDLKDLRRKIVRAGGDTAVLAFGAQDLETIYADVFRCAGVRATAPTLPPGVPPPPAGTPPPPPPGPVR